MQFELHLFEPVGYVGAVDAAHVDGPFVGVVGVGGGFAVGGVDGFGGRAVDLGGGTLVEGKWGWGAVYLPKGRYIWTPCRRSFLVSFGVGMSGSVVRRLGREICGFAEGVIRT